MEQIAILKALEHIEVTETGDKIVLIHTDSQRTLQLLQNKEEHTRLIELIRTKINEMEQHKWSVDLTWMKAHAGHPGNETSDHLAKETANNKNIEESYTKISKNAILNELKRIVKSSGKVKGKTLQKEQQQNSFSLKQRTD